MMGINPGQLLVLVIRPTLELIGLGGRAREELMLGTCLQESGCGYYLHQLGNGPAIGPAEMETATHDDLWANFLKYRPEMAAKIESLIIPGLPKAAQMAGNFYYAFAMATLPYYRSPAPLPAAGDLAGQAGFYKAVYNTAKGAATTQEYIANWNSAKASSLWPPIAA
jgi:hypothetical protein